MESPFVSDPYDQIFFDLHTYRLSKSEFVEMSLMVDNPPRFSDHKKALLFETYGRCTHPESKFQYSRWKAFDPSLSPFTSGGRVEKIEVVNDVEPYSYSRHRYPDYSKKDNLCNWFVNFSGPMVAYTYSGDSMGVDELQCIEHPAMCSLMEHMWKEELKSYINTSDDNGQPTPCLFKHIERKMALPFDACSIFDSISAQELVYQTESLHCCRHYSNIICIEAPSVGLMYTKEILKKIYTTAYSGFRAAVVTTKLEHGKDTLVQIHTGHWGCGAYGGNAYVMAVLQMRAADDAGVDVLQYHTMNSRWAMVVNDAITYSKFSCPSTPQLDDLLDDLAAKNIPFKSIISDHDFDEFRLMISRPQV